MAGMRNFPLNCNMSINPPFNHKYFKEQSPGFLPNEGSKRLENKLNYA